MQEQKSAEQILYAAERLLQNLKGKGLKIAFAESMTGGLLSGSLTRIPGASSVLCGSVVCYDHASKMRLLHVPSELLQLHGAESAEVTAAMARGLENLFPDAGILLAITGSASVPVNDYRIASPPGRVFICFGKVGEHFQNVEWQLSGERNEVLNMAILQSFERLNKYLQ